MKTIRKLKWWIAGSALAALLLMVQAGRMKTGPAVAKQAEQNNPLQLRGETAAPQPPPAVTAAPERIDATPVSVVSGVGGTIIAPMQPAGDSKASSTAIVASAASKADDQRKNVLTRPSANDQTINQGATGPSPSVSPSAGFPKPLPAGADLSKITLLEIMSQPVDLTNPAARAEQERQLGLVSEARRQAAIARAQQMGLPVEGATRGGGRYAIQDFSGEQPVYHSTENANAAISTAADQASMSSAYPTLDGTGMTVGVWDGNLVRRKHMAFLLGATRFSRISQYQGTGLSDHATHVAGTIAGLAFTPSIVANDPAPILSTDVPGMAPEAQILSFDFNNDIAKLAEKAAVTADLGSTFICLSNHSYGENTGWAYLYVQASNDSVWQWNGAGNGVGTTLADFDFGNYDTRSAEWDTLVYTHPFLLPVLSAGNDGNDRPDEGEPWALSTTPAVRQPYVESLHAPGDGRYKNGYDTLGVSKVTKNTLVVGSVSDAVSGGVRSTAVARPSDFSSWGPTDDGRIKPDIVANGDDLASASSRDDSAATWKSGTSMAAPNATGSAALLQQLFRTRHNGQVMRASLLKGLIIHTATDLETPGPDYRTGWGLMNTLAAANLIEQDSSGAGGGELFDDTIASGGTKTYERTWDGTQPLRVTLCWTDLAGPTNNFPTNDSRTPRLVNDLDITVTGPTGIVYRPFVMPHVGDWTGATFSAAATTGTNHVDNVEQVYLPAPAAGLYTITVTPFNSIIGTNQTFSLIISGGHGQADIVVEHPAGAQLTDGVSTIGFGTVSTVERVVKNFLVRNTGGADLQITGVTVNGANAGDYSILQPETTMLKPGASTYVGVVFAPTAAGTRTAALHIATDLPFALASFDVNLTGAGSPVTVYSPTYDVLRSFDNLSPGNANGHTPRGGLVFQGTTAYGNTSGGGASSGGVAFTVDTAGSFSLLGSVYSASPPGMPVQPVGPFTSGGTLLGISALGGINSSGALYVMSGATATTFCSFPSSHSGGAYGSNVVAGSGGYYGTATFGGTGGFGTIFKVSTAGVYSVVVNFTGTGGANKGSQPCPQLVAAPDGMIYGATRFGGTSDLGTVFRLNGSTLETLVEFGAISGNTLGVNPTVAPIVASDGALYGTAGTRLYRVSTTGGGGTSLGTTPSGIATPLLEGPDGRLYGVTGTGPYVLQLTLQPYGGPYTSAISSQYLDFNASPPVFPPPNTPTPSPLALGPDGHLYGTSQTGGVNSDGTVYRVRTNFGANPEIDVQQPVGTSIQSGLVVTKPVAFPNIAVGQNATRVFVIQNTSTTGTLYLRRFVKGGTNASEFNLSVPAQTDIPPGRSTTFSVTYAPSSAGLKQAFIEIYNNDLDESIFSIGLTNAVPEIAVEEPVGVNQIDEQGVIDFGTVPVGSSVVKSIRVKNVGTGSLEVTGTSTFGLHSGDFTIGSAVLSIAQGANASFNVTFTPSAAGFRAVDLHIDNNDADENPFDLILTGNGFATPAPEPEIAVEQPAGSALTSGLSAVDFGVSGVGVPVPLTFTIRNTSTSVALALGAITVDGANSADFVPGAPGLTTVPPGGTTTLVVTFTRGSAAARSATLHIASNAGDDNPFDLLLVAPVTGAALPDITLTTSAGAGIVDGSATPQSFGSVTVGQSAARNFIIRNDGLIPLTLGSVTINGVNAADFSATPPDLDVLPPGAAISMQVRFRPLAGGVRNAALHIASTDPDENPFDINLTGTGLSGPEIAVEQPVGTNLTDGAANIGFGTFVVGASSAAQVFTIRNAGSQTLTGIAVSKSGAGNPADFILSTVGTSTSLAAGASTTFTVTFAPTTAGARAAALLIASNDADENPFDIALNGTATSPAAQLTSPVNGTVLTSGTATFNWSAGTGVTSYALWIGSTPGGYDVYAGNEGTALARTITTLPTDGRALYVTLHSLIGGAYQNNSYTFTAWNAPKPVKARLTSPANGSSLTSTSLALTWDAGVNVTSYYLFVGTVLDGSNLYAGDQGTAVSRTVTVPATGGRIYVTLWSLIKGAYQSNSYVFNAQAPVKAALTSPANGATLANGNLALAWNAGVGVTSYALWIGSYEGGYDLGAAAETGLSRTMPVPVDGGPVYVTLWSLINGGWQGNTYWFATALPGSGSRPARLTSHANTSTLTTRDTTFTWDAGVGVVLYNLWVGSTPNGTDIYAASEPSTSRTVSLPADGRRIHVTLHSLIGGVWQSNSYYFTDSISASPLYAVINTPATGATLTSASLTLGWTTGTNVNNYFLYLGSAPGGYDLYSGSQGLNLSRTLTVPTDGRPIYATLFSLIKGTYQQSTTWFTTVNLSGTVNKARMTSPANASVLPGATTTFSWDPGLAASNYTLWIGSSPGAYDLYAGAEGANIARTVTLPTDSRKIYVTLWSFISGAYQSNSYFYTAASIAPVKAAITSPASGAIFTTASQTFAWSASNAATQYALWIGRKPGGYDAYAGAEGLNLTKTVTTLPTDGGPVYVTLWSLINGAWQGSEHIYQAWLAP